MSVRVNVFIKSTYLMKTHNKVHPRSLQCLRAVIDFFIIIIISPPTQCYNYKRRFQNGEKAQGNHEAYAMWAFSSKYNKHHSIIIGRRWRYNETLQKK